MLCVHQRDQAEAIEPNNLYHPKLLAEAGRYAKRRPAKGPASPQMALVDFPSYIRARVPSSDFGFCKNPFVFNIDVNFRF